ncbi:MAG: DUF3179 domain-containing protein [Balneolaceae bacterium]
MKKLNVVSTIILSSMLLLFTHDVQSQSIPGFSTDVSQRSISLNELIPGGPGKDGIPSIDDPKFISQTEASRWLRDQEPIVLVEVDGEARAYPIQILMWHEMVNDWFGDRPVLVTFCPLCYSAITFDRRINGEVHEFGVSGMLRKSDMIMYDRNTESLWQQFSAEALVGEYTGEFLDVIPSQIISFAQFRENFPGAQVLSRDTGHRRNYGQNPYVGYDDINSNPWALQESPTDRMKPMEKVLGVRVGDNTMTYPYSVTRERVVLQDDLGGKNLVIFHTEGAVSAMDRSTIHRSREDGSTGVFFREVDGQTLDFEYVNGEIKDKQTGSTWSVVGRATAGPMEGKQLETAIYGDYFAFAWLVFYPESPIFASNR